MKRFRFWSYLEVCACLGTVSKKNKEIQIEELKWNTNYSKHFQLYFIEICNTLYFLHVFVTAFSANGKDVIVDFPQQSHWTGLLSEMELVPSIHPGVT